MHSPSRFSPRALVAPIAIVAVAALIAAGCARKSSEPDTTDLRLEPVGYAGASAFTPPVGADRSDVTPPANTGGTYAGNTTGLYGGTENVSTCDPHAMVTFLRRHPDKATAWAGVLGIAPADIAGYVAGLTSVVLRSDTVVTNHGFDNGHATTIPAVLQAGTAVLVNQYGAPVTKCFCGNPLTTPSSYQRITFVGTSWSYFSATSITLIQPAVTVINQFTLVEPVTGASFDRKVGTDGTADTPVTPGTASAPPTPPPGGHSPTAPPTTAPTGPTGSAPPHGSVAPYGSAAPHGSVAPYGSAAPHGSVAPYGSAAPHGSVAPYGSPSSGGSVVPGAPGVSTPPTGAGASGHARTATTSASWVAGGCFVDRAGGATMKGTVLVRNNDTAAPHTYQVTVEFGPGGSYGRTTTTVGPVPAGRTWTVAVDTPATGAVPGGTSPPCVISTIVDENGTAPTQGPALPAPPAVAPQATTPSTTSGVPTPSTVTPSTVTPSTPTPNPFPT